MHYPVLCYGRDCSELAVYKIAARWSHGASSELKTYGLACPSCLPMLYRSSLQRQKLARTLSGELGEKPGIYLLREGSQDQQLQRMVDLELKLRTEDHA